MHTGLFLKVLDDLSMPFEYYYTDISAAFFVKAEQKFEKYMDSVVFKKFNIAEDPLLQGFTPGYFDIIVAAEVIHATRSIRETLGNLRLVLRDGGVIQVLETTRRDRRFTFLFGLLEGYWSFKDFDVRQDHATLPPDQWENLLNSCGFELSVAVPCYESVHSVIFGVGSPNYYPDGMYRLAPFEPPPYKPKWLIFGDKSNLCRVISERLVSLDRDVIILDKEEDLEKVSNKDFIVTILGTKGTEDTEKAKGKDTTEGILYLWGMVGADIHDHTKFTKPFLYLSQYLWDNQKSGIKTFVVTQGTRNLDDSKYMNPSPTTLAAIAKVLRSETSIHVKCVDIPSNKTVDEQIEHIFHEIWYTGDCEDLLAYRDDKRLVARMAKLKATNDSLCLPKGTDRFQLVLPATRLINDLQFGFLGCFTLGDKEVEVKLKAAALNFRDVFAVLKPDPQFDKINSVGTDIAGIVTAIGPNVTLFKVGDPVLGMHVNNDQALPSYLKLPEDTLMSVPTYMTFAEACTLPVVFATAYYCLVTIAKIGPTDTILIHTASGGVGLSAIEIAQRSGATIIATAGSERKRAYLKSLGIQHIFHSRNTNYGQQIMEVTNGKGVNIVLNSLTGPGFKEASLNCCAEGARFVEMSKLSVWKPEEVKALREDVEYTIADVATMDEKELRSLFEKLKEVISRETVKPIPYERFDAVRIRAALNHLQKAKHVGKIVCIFPEIKLKDSKFTASTPIFNDRSTYIITGGVTGGIGLETAKYMLTQGAKYIVLVGRSKPQEKGEELLKIWKSEGYHVQAWQVDVGDIKQCADFIKRIKDPASGLPPIRGIMHCAGTLSDGTIPNQTWDKFEHTYNAKVFGSWNLHHLTLDCSLEHFVFFSSMASLVG